MKLIMRKIEEECKWKLLHFCPSVQWYLCNGRSTDMVLLLDINMTPGKDDCIERYQTSVTAIVHARYVFCGSILFAWHTYPGTNEALGKNFGSRTIKNTFSFLVK